ncbi:L,D-transpeptidase [Thalassovita sp.]|uniref:L,D-transpeptidase n=1 Tax=Thalassovita sp. TaxID=1979401 RepID=UPI0029DE612B|nr:L,D-transpeptidase [Thalassovita sp.]
MTRVHQFLAGVLITLGLVLPHRAGAEILQVRVDLSEQIMRVYLDNRAVYLWPISSARPGKVTPLGTFHPQFLSANHKSSLYDNAPMPWSVFFYGHYAIHGTTELSKLGQPASAGCIRLHPENAEILFALVQARDKQSTFIVVEP